jgi:hypothetical protein
MTGEAERQRRDAARDPEQRPAAPSAADGEDRDERRGHGDDAQLADMRVEAGEQRAPGEVGTKRDVPERTKDDEDPTPELHEKGCASMPPADGRRADRKSDSKQHRGQQAEVNDGQKQRGSRVRRQHGLRPGIRADAEGIRAANDVRIRGHDLPSHDIASGLEALEMHRDPRWIRGRMTDAAERLHVSARIQDAQRAERRFDRFVKRQRHRLRRTLDAVAGGRITCRRRRQARKREHAEDERDAE